MGELIELIEGEFKEFSGEIVNTVYCIYEGDWVAVVSDSSNAWDRNRDNRFHGGLMELARICEAVYADKKGELIYCCWTKDLKINSELRVFCPTHFYEPNPEEKK